MDVDVRKDPKAFNDRPESTGSVTGSKPMTGAEYIESLRDGREVFLREAHPLTPQPHVVSDDLLEALHAETRA